VRRSSGIEIRTNLFSEKEASMSQDFKCFFCSSDDIRLAEIGIAIGMGGDDYSFCQRCLESMVAQDFWKRMFQNLGIEYPAAIQ
jgi:hypothetical protein